MTARTANTADAEAICAIYNAGIEPFAWIVNQSFAASGTEDPLLLTKADQERAVIREVESLAPQLVVLPWRDGGADNS